MNAYWNAYEYVILDFSAMFADVEYELAAQLDRDAGNFLVAPTFSCECSQIRQVASKRIAAQYLKNCGLIRAGDIPVCRQYGTVDTFGLAEKLSQQSGDVLVIEANYSLEDKIILDGIGVDVYNVLEGRLIRKTAQSRERTDRKLTKTKTPLPYYEVSENSWVYTEKGKYLLSREMTSGAEARIFAVNGCPELLAKVYLEDPDGQCVLTKEKLDNIRELTDINGNWDVDWLAFPQAILYADAAHTRPVGYLMKYFRDADFFSENDLFTGGSIVEKFPKLNDVTVGDVLDICIRFVRQILFLSINDIHISDFNDKNFASSGNHPGRIVMIDTDSYCCQDYVSDCKTFAGALSRQYTDSTKAELIRFCEESLVAFVFTRLVLDWSFLPMRKSKFRMSNATLTKLDNPNLWAKWTSVPLNLRQLFSSVFEEKKPASMSVLLYELEAARGQRLSDIKYREFYKKILEADAANSGGGAGTKSPGSKPEPGPGSKPEPKPSTPPTPPKPKPQTGSVHQTGAHPSSGTGKTTKKKKKKKRGIWRAALAIFLVGCMGLGIAGILTHLDLMGGQNIQEGSGGAQQQEVPQAQRYDTDNGYYYSQSGTLDGYVEYYWDIGDVYKGEFTDGVRTGSGDYTWAGGKRYVGQFVEGRREGRGSYYNETGELIYEGGWLDNQFHGEGTYHFPNGTASYATTWDQGTCSGGEEIKLNFTETGEPAAEGYWKESRFYGKYMDNGQWKEL